MLLMRHGRKTCHTTGDYKCRVDSYGFVAGQRTRSDARICAQTQGGLEVNTSYY